MDLKGKVALVSGGATGLGRYFCEELLRNGAKVSICDLDSDAGENAYKFLSEAFGKDRILFCHCDVTDYVQYEEAFQSTLAEFDGLDIVVNNAEIMNDKFWELEVDVNLNGAIRGTLLGLQFMGKDKGGQGGVVVNIGSAASFRPQVFSPPIYTATKHAILGLSRSCGDAYHFNTTAVRVIAFCPGLLASENGSSVTHNNRFKSPAHEKAWQADMKGVVPQSMEHVAKGLINILKDASSGSVWLIANGTAPKEIPFSHETTMEHVAKGLINILKDASSGSVWLIANGTAPKEIPFSHETTMEHVAKGLINILKDASSGSVWLIANGTAPKEIPFSHETT